MRLIDADAADVERIVCYYGDNCRIEDVQEWLDDQPTIDAAPVRRGEWVHGKRNGAYGIWCSRCGTGWEESPNYEVIAASHNFCPNCGADMRTVSE